MISLNIQKFKVIEVFMDFSTFLEEISKKKIAVFTVRDAARITGKNAEYCKLFLSRLAKRGKILRIERGKYCLKNADLYEVASNLAFPSCISFLSALSFHGITTQIPYEVQVACSRQKKPVEFGNARIVFVKMKKRAIFGFVRHGNAFVAEPEKAIIDCLYLPGMAPVPEVFYALKQKEMSLQKLEKYAGRLDSAVVKKRLGYLLEKAGIRTGLIGRKLNYKMDALNPLLPKKGERNAKWRIIVNEVLE